MNAANAQDFANTLNTVLYALSTIAQTCAALAALVGALALFKLQTMRDERAATERTIRAIVLPALGPRDATLAQMLRFARLNIEGASSLSPTIVDMLRESIAEWDAFPARYRRRINTLLGFEMWNLVAILFAFVGFACASWLASHWVTFVVGLIFLSVGTVVVTGGALYLMAGQDTT